MHTANTVVGDDDVTIDRSIARSTVARRRPGRRAQASSAHRAPREGDATMGDGGGDDGLDAHRRVLGVTREATIGDVRRAFLEVAKRAHPDVATSSTSTRRRTTTRGGGGGVVRGDASFRDAVEAREALVRSMMYASRGGGGGGGGASAAFGAGAARTAGTPQTKAYAAALAAPAFVVAAVVMFAFPSTKTYGLDGHGRDEFAMGRVHGVMNAPVNPWLKPEATRPAKTSDEDRMWRRVFGGGERWG